MAWPAITPLPRAGGRGSWPARSRRPCPPPFTRWGWLIREAVTGSEEETSALAAALAESFRGGEVVLLSGELGAGKTAFVRGLARGLGADPTDVASPTFVLLTSYPGRLVLHHADLYRLRGDGDDDELGLEELPGRQGVLAVEWAERLSRVPWPQPVRVTLEHAGEDRRRVRIEGAAS